MYLCITGWAANCGVVPMCIHRQKSLLYVQAHIYQPSKGLSLQLQWQSHDGYQLCDEVLIEECNKIGVCTFGILDDFNNLWAQQDSERFNETKDLNVGHPLSHTDGYMRVDNDRFKAFVQGQEQD